MGPGDIRNVSKMVAVLEQTGSEGRPSSPSDPHSGSRHPDLADASPMRRRCSAILWTHLLWPQSGGLPEVNVGVELESDVPPPPQPVLECDEGCIAAINDCIEEGCSVDAIMKLDKKLAEDEQKVQATMASIEGQQKTGYTEENTGSLAWLKNFLGRSGSLRAQLQALKTIEDGDFIKQMVKAASVAFGGGRTGDYPKVGVSPYSS
ncbi:unnamed protein product [Prorocentrum cordatum]|uniref:Uncharacterized protein n=1 Tax=Prorocentrum cordatum TaxID=2364126 RepID=A0ABN9PQQ2_9DINO|nr:unnamed protein product [Polarella glacialis]